MRPTIYITKKTISHATLALIGALGASVRAQNCKPMMDSLNAKTQNTDPVRCCWVLRATVASGQANKLDTFTGRTDIYTNRGALMWASPDGSFSPYTPGEMQFSDRVNSAVDSNQNFSVVPSAVEKINVAIAQGGSSATIKNLTWGYTITIQNPVCSDGLMYGFGTPVGNTNAGRPAMWIIAFALDTVIG